MMADLGLTHIALPATDLDASAAFYARYADMEIVHRRENVAWISDRTRPFVIVLFRAEHVERPLGPFAHLGVACASRAVVDERCATARDEGCLAREPHDSGPPVGYWAFISDPDGHTLELTFGQDVDGSVFRSAD